MGRSSVILPLFGHWNSGHIQPGEWALPSLMICMYIGYKFQVKGELEWKVGKWAGVPVRPGIAHWERRERVEAKEREMEGGEKGDTQGEGKEGKVMEGDEEIEEGISSVVNSHWLYGYMLYSINGSGMCLDVWMYVCMCVTFLLL